MSGASASGIIELTEDDKIKALIKRVAILEIFMNERSRNMCFDTFLKKINTKNFVIVNKYLDLNTSRIKKSFGNNLYLLPSYEAITCSIENKFKFYVLHKMLHKKGATLHKIFI